MLRKFSNWLRQRRILKLRVKASAKLQTIRNLEHLFNKNIEITGYYVNKWLSAYEECERCMKEIELLEEACKR